VIVILILQQAQAVENRRYILVQRSGR